MGPIVLSILLVLNLVYPYKLMMPYFDAIDLKLNTFINGKKWRNFSSGFTCIIYLNLSYLVRSILFYFQLISI